MENETTVLTLSDNRKYVVVKKLFYQNKKYLYLIEVDNQYHQILCEVNDNKIKLITDENIMKQIILNAKEK